jgi:hypothetical protein
LKTDRKGYLAVNLSKDGVVKTCKVHRLLALAFIENPNNYPQVNHKDGNKRNNSLTNFEWCNNKQNAEHASRLGLVKGGRKSVGLKAVHIQTGETILFAKHKDAERYGFDSSTISKCCNGKRNSHKDYQWAYAN